MRGLQGRTPKVPKRRTNFGSCEVSEEIRGKGRQEGKERLGNAELLLRQKGTREAHREPLDVEGVHGGIIRVLELCCLCGIQRETAAEAGHSLQHHHKALLSLESRAGLVSAVSPHHVSPRAVLPVETIRGASHPANELLFLLRR